MIYDEYVRYLRERYKLECQGESAAGKNFNVFTKNEKKIKEEEKIRDLDEKEKKIKKFLKNCGLKYECIVNVDSELWKTRSIKMIELIVKNGISKIDKSYPLVYNEMSLPGKVDSESSKKQFGYMLINAYEFLEIDKKGYNMKKYKKDQKIIKF